MLHLVQPELEVEAGRRLHPLSDGCSLIENLIRIFGEFNGGSPQATISLTQSHSGIRRSPPPLPSSHPLLHSGRLTERRDLWLLLSFRT